MLHKPSMRRIAISFTLAFVLALGPFSHVPCGKASANGISSVLPPSVDSPSCVVMDAISGEVLFQKEAQLKRNPASVTKIMTLTLILEDVASGKIKLTDEAVTSENAWEMGGTEVWAEPGESMPVEEWIKAIAVASANDAAVVMAEHLSGTEEAFVARMNQRAKELGMNNTSYKNPHGLDAEGHVTSAMDMALLSRHAVNVPHLLDYTKVYMQEFRGGKNMLTNFNKLVYLYSGCDGLKTGFTSKSGYCLSATAAREESRFIVVLMGSETPDQRMNDAWRLLDWAFANFRSMRVLDETQEIAQARVFKGRQDTVEIVPQSTLAITLTKDQKGEITQEITLGKIVAPIQKGDVIGSIQVAVDGDKFAEIALVAGSDVPRARFLDYVLRYLKAFTVGK